MWRAAFIGVCARVIQGQNLVSLVYHGNRQGVAQSRPIRRNNNSLCWLFLFGWRGKNVSLSTRFRLVNVTATPCQHKVANLFISLGFALGLCTKALIFFIEPVNLRLLFADLLLGLRL